MKKFLAALGLLLGAVMSHAGAAGKFGDPADTVNEYLYVLNGDAVDHGVGSVMVWSDASAVTVSTTTSADKKTYAGVVAFNTLPASGLGWIQVYGYHSAVKVGVATAAGDGIATSTTAGKAGVGTTAGAILGAFLEATTSSTTAKGFIHCQ